MLPQRSGEKKSQYFISAISESTNEVMAHTHRLQTRCCQELCLHSPLSRSTICENHLYVRARACVYVRVCVCMHTLYSLCVCVCTHCSVMCCVFTAPSPGTPHTPLSGSLSTLRGSIIPHLPRLPPPSPWGSLITVSVPGEGGWGLQ